MGRNVLENRQQLHQTSRCAYSDINFEKPFLLRICNAVKFAMAQDVGNSCLKAFLQFLMPQWFCKVFELSHWSCVNRTKLLSARSRSRRRKHGVFFIVLTTYYRFVKRAKFPYTACTKHTRVRAISVVPCSANAGKWMGPLPSCEKMRLKCFHFC